MRYALWVLGCGVFAVTLSILFLVWFWYPSGSPKDGEFVHLRQSFQVWGEVHGVALDEDRGRLVVVTEGGVSCYAYPSCTHVRSCSMRLIGLVGLLRRAIVVRTPELEVVLLDPETLEVKATYRGTCRKAAVNQDQSILAMLDRDNRLTVVSLSDTGAPEEKTAPFPNVDYVSAFAVLPDGEVLYSTLADGGFYRLRPPYDTPELIVKSRHAVDALQYIQVCEGGKSFLTLGPNVIRIWDREKMEPTRTVLYYWKEGGGRYGHLELTRGPDQLDLDTHAAPPRLFVKYWPSNDVLIINDGIPKRGRVVFASASTADILDELWDCCGPVTAKIAASRDGKTLITAQSHTIQRWEVSPFNP
jgi:hypothetical protein